ncbi:protein ENHANCED DISEASE RESISTANCE 4-like isoform X1 [Actinidia eriantha]|uniref:protein ENHANCED DISEASE RESISTANCE 4-like isoform X1 n=2 Tax=Actinidia eriantha TaxID=165200 RepID=UPI0025904380|nr:protein ENHANCED DISEASE RESISTANCE 4-like isoform X1 [Actinidia eriantha]
MSEPGEVRLVRCPKCQNLLPELIDYSVYQCGGCGAVLRAKNRNSESDTLSQKSDEERVQGVPDKIPKKPDNFKFSEKVMDLSDGSENDVKSNVSYSRRADKRNVLSYRTDNQRNGLSIKDNKWLVDKDLVANENLNESGHEQKGKELEDLKPQNRIPNGSRRTGRVADWRSGEVGEVEGLWRNPEREFHGVRYSTTKYSEGGPSNYHLRSSYGYGEQVKNQNKPDEFNKVEYLEQDRAELLRKLDELKDQISRSCDVKDKPKEKVPLDRRSARHEDPYSDSEPLFPEGSWCSNRASSQYSVPDLYIARPPYQRHYPEPYPNMNRLEKDRHSFYPSMHVPNQVQRYGDPLRSQMLRRAPQTPGILQQQPSHPYFSERYVENDMDPLEPYPPNMNFHHPSCSCFYCYNKHPQGPGPGPAPPNSFHNKMFPDVPNNMIFYHHENPSTFGTRDHNSKIVNPTPLNPNLPQSHIRWPSDLSSEVDSFVHRYPTRVVQATCGRRCRAIVGGAPFVICYNCFQLLQLPKKILVMEKNQKKVLCGACSTVIPFAVVNKKLLVSAHAETNISPKMLDDSHFRVNANHTGMNFSSNDYDNSGYDFQSMDREAISSSTGLGVCSRKSAEMRSDHSTSSYSSEDMANPDSLNAQGLESNSAELAAKANQPPPPAGSLLQDHFDYSSKYNAVNQFGKGNQSGRGDNEEPKKVTSRQDSMKDASLATEMKVSFNEYSNTGTSQESRDVTREEYQPRVNKGGRTFFAGIIKKSFRDLSRSNHTIEQSSTNVTINGHPISDRTLRKAEKMAGPVHPGHYWYDFRAGFWGVMGGPCLGIIPPFIEEFNHPMPENCAGGNTGIFVNGRELHLKDLNLLGSRGLATTTDRSYIIEISGRVLDEDSGEELDSLGKLAPTVEKAKHGFGMKVPRVAT